MPLRTFGGVSRSELLKTLWVPVTGGTTRVTKGNHTAYRIVNPGDEALCEMFLPTVGFSAVWEARIQYICNATLANMFVDVNMDWAYYGQVFNVNTAGATYSPATTINTIQSQAIEALLAGITVAARLGVRITYNAGPFATNMDVLGLVITWR